MTPIALGPAQTSGLEQRCASVLERMQDLELKFSEWWFTDLSGKPWRMDVAASHVKLNTFEQGITLDGPSTGRPWRGLFNLKPDANSCFVDPVAQAPTMAMFCDVRDAETGDSTFDARSTLSRARQRLIDSGIADTLLLGAECEFILTDEEGMPVAEELLWDFIRELALALEKAGISVEGFRFGPSAGQGRVQMAQADILKTADQAIFYRYIAKALARRQNLRAIFDPGPGDAYLPLHFSLWKDGQNLFHDENGWALTSGVCRSFAAGLLHHSSALLAFTAPKHESYRRLTQFGAPNVRTLSHARADAAVRVPARSTSPQSRRLKFRLCDGSANPYIAFAALLMAGLDGVERRLTTPIEEPLPLPLPKSLFEAVDALEGDKDFLEGAFADKLLGWWIQDRRAVPIGKARA
jgi:glutamine synthetase